MNNYIDSKIVLQTLHEVNDSCFIYDLDSLEEHGSNIINSSPDNVQLFYACKANPLSHIIDTLHKSGFGFDIASKGELQQVINCGISGDKIIMTGPMKDKELMTMGLQHKISAFVIESLNQAISLQKLLSEKEYGYNPSIIIRLQLKWNTTEKSTLGGSEVTQFGVDLPTAKEIINIIGASHIKGFHVFQWNNILDPDKIYSIWDHTIQECKSFASSCGIDKLNIIDVGGGLGIPYTHNEKDIDWRDIINIIQDLSTKHEIEKFWIELGRYVVGPYGRYITKIVDIKNTYDKNMIIVKGGINHMARPALIQDSQFPIEQIIQKNSDNNKNNIDNVEYSIHGPLCTSIDKLGTYTLNIKPIIGDIIVFNQIGAYGFTESMPFFLCHDLPAEVIIKNKEIQIVRDIKSANEWQK